MGKPLMTFEDWVKSPDLVAAWAKTWEEPHMKLGLQVLMQHALPKASLTLPTGVTLLEHLASQRMRDCGYFDALRNIEVMKVERKPNEQAEGRKGWGEIDRNDPMPENLNREEK